MISDKAEDFFSDLDPDQKRQLIDNMLDQGEDISKIGEMKRLGTYLHFLSEDTLVDLFNSMPESFFDGNFWNENHCRYFGSKITSVFFLQRRI